MSPRILSPRILSPHILSSRVGLFAPRATGFSLRSLGARLLAALALRRSRARLANLEPHLLRDIGLTPEQARAEARHPLWDAPANWRKAG